MYQKFLTDGIILRKLQTGEANIVAFIFTKEFGLVRAVARSARSEKSKLRYGLEPLTSARFCLLRGKSEWRLTGVDTMTRLPPGKEFAYARRVCGRVSTLLSRLIQGQEPSKELFATVQEAFDVLSRIETKEGAEAVECVLVLRILAHLGYLPRTPEMAPFLDQDLFSIELTDAAARSRSLLIKAINESLHASGL